MTLIQHNADPMRSSLFYLLFLFASIPQANAEVCSHYQIENVSAQTVRSEFDIKCQLIDHTLYIDGVIDKSLLKVLKDSPDGQIQKIELNSFGGNALASVDLAHWIYLQNVETSIRAHAVCHSACTLLFQTGQIRKAHITAELVYHSARFSNPSYTMIEVVRQCNSQPEPGCLEFLNHKISMLQEFTDEFFSLLELYGVAKDFYETYRLLDDDPLWIENGNYLKTKDWYLSAEEAKTYGIVTEILTH